MSSVSILVGKSGPTSQDHAFRKLAEFHGLETEFVTADKVGNPKFLATSAQTLEEAGPNLQLPSALGPGSCCFVQSAPIENENLTQLARLKSSAPCACVQSAPIENENLTQLKKLPVAPPCAFVQSAPIENENLTQLARLTGNAVTGTQTAPGGRKTFAVRQPFPLPRYPMTGVQFTADSDPVPSLRPGPQFGSATVHMTVDDQPYFASVKNAGVQIWVLSDNSLIDLDQALPPETDLTRWHAPIMAISIALRAAFGAACWSRPRDTANFIVDDPYLKWHYGAVRYRPLVERLKQSDLALTIAFIPFNYRRSRRDVVSYLRANADRVSISVHGCDHTSGEYAGRDGQWMAGLTGEALHRMREHEAATGMPFDRTMVFPQGRFSLAGIRSLKPAGIKAAVNSTPWTVDGTEVLLTVRDLLDGAVHAYAGCPLFMRRYPHEGSALAFDALMQKTVLAVEHHAYFLDGGERMGQFAQFMRGAVPQIAWQPMARALAGSHVIRQTGPAEFLLRHHYPDWHHENASGEAHTLTVQMAAANGEAEGVSVNGQSAAFDRQDGRIQYTVQAPGGANLDGAVAFKMAPEQRLQSTLKYRVKATVRRLLSDLRDELQARKILSVK